MNWFKFRNVVLVLVVMSLVALFSCSKDSTSSEPDLNEQYVQEAAAAAEYSVVYMETATSTASAATMAANTGGSFAKALGIGDTTLYDGCPAIIWNMLQKQLTIDYGEGCTGPAGINHSGSIVMNGSLNNQTLQFAVTFNNFTTVNCTVGGSMTYVMTMQYAEVAITNGTITCGDSTVTVNANLKITVDMNGTPGDPTDDSYTVTGQGTVVTPDGSKYSFQITDPLLFYAGCQYPVRGVIEIAGTDYTAKVDFYPENGDCDDIAEISVGPLKKKVHLSTIF